MVGRAAGQTECQEFFATGIVAFERHDYAEALAHLRKIPDHGILGILARYYRASAHLRLGNQTLGAGDYTHAAGHFLLARDLNPAAESLARWVITSLLVSQGSGAVAAHGEPLPPKPIDLASQRLHAAWSTWKAGRHTDAIALVESAVADVPQCAELYQTLATMRGAREQYAEAEAAHRKSIELDPHNARYHLRLGLCLGAQHRTCEALEALQRARQLQPQDPEIGFMVSIAARDHVGRLRMIDTESSASAATQESPTAFLRELVIQDHDFAEAFLTLPEGTADQELFSVLAAVLGEAVELHPDYPDLQHHFARVLDRLGRPDAAIAAIHKALEINPRMVSALVTLARLYQKTNRRADAVARLEEAVGLGAAYADVYFLLGTLYQEEGRKAEARNAYVRALQLNVNYDAAREALKSVAA